MPGAVLTPFDTGQARRAGERLWRKRLLPVGSIDYKGRKIDFTRQYNDQLAAAFKSSAYDQVPFQLADAKNTHTNDPERFRGEIVSMDSQPDGLWVTVKPTPEGEKVLASNPKLGVSARIVEDYARSDGQYFPFAVQHVLGTLDPRVPGLGGWQSVHLAGSDVDFVVDLSTEAFPQEDAVPGLELTPEQQARLAKLLETDPDKLKTLLDSAPTGQPPSQPGDGNEPGDELSDAELDELIALYDQTYPDGETGDGGGDLSDEDLAALLEDGEPAPAQLSSEAQMAIELANARADETERRLSGIQARFDEQAYTAERRKLAEDFGIPPYITDLARPLLEGSGKTIELAGGEEVDAGAIVRKVFVELGKMGKLLDLGPEIGHSNDVTLAHEDAAAAEARQQVVQRYREITGI